MANQKDVTANSEAGDYPVGYGKPPKHTQFKPGTSGNPKGRPKETKNLKTDLVEELAEKILVHEGDGSKKISKQRAVVKSLVTRTLKGDARAANTLLPMMMRLLDTGEGAQTEEPEELHPDELEILEAYKARLTGSRSQEGPAEATNASNAEIQSADADAGSEEEAQ